MSSYHVVGNIKRTMPSALADKAAIHIRQFTTGHRLAVTIDTSGRVAVEPVTSSAEADLIGVYENKGELKKIAELINADLAFEVENFR